MKFALARHQRQALTFFQTRELTGEGVWSEETDAAGTTTYVFLVELRYDITDNVALYIRSSTKDNRNLLYPGELVY